MNIKLLSLAVASLISTSAVAVTIDYRHEMQDQSGNTHKDRLLMSHRFANGFGLSLEGKWKGAQDKDKPFNETVSNGTEVVASYVYKINNTFSIEPGFSLDSNSTSNNYRPYLRGKAVIVDDLSVSLRYRPYYKRTSANINTPKDTSENGYNLTSVISYKVAKDYQLDYEIDYKQANKAGVVLADKENYDWSHDLKLTYKWDKNWSPYMALGNVSGSKNTDERQTRYRVGVKYSF
ncbi:porin [Yersinia pseudotuberculosis]|uniref:Oligogalacturonate-specific porin protein KdgM n=2 Tax=Yersinia pseudotuberculosis complex TaxID=1649845 RepID=A0A0T9JJG1_YERPU|nr:MULTISPECIES: oligogalacturonate-specific porin KdgM family protein [Yersinia pseudotuberculosis complex]PSH14557.1 porin [Yersinia pseudotuberculosis]CNC81588.1 oligogalacturonate-specific porin protein KdgM [Yersinia pseudotuberculosis]CRG50863.1 oligogalacturonate-specific porin protein KdgM [Yersinia wautersii]SUP80059.1 oligogalacturonate-specific porin protein KdgM [Yersinia pseudotuberculosis]